MTNQQAKVLALVDKPVKNELKLLNPSLSLSQCSEKSARELLKYELALKFEVLPLSIRSILGVETLSVACVDNTSVELKNTLKFASGYEVELYPVNKELILDAIFIAYNTDDSQLVSSIKKLEFIELKSQDYFNSKVSLRDSDELVSKFLEQLLDHALALQASDIHILATGENTNIRFRIQGDLSLKEINVGNRQSHQQLINRIKILSNLDITQKQKPQEGAFKVEIKDKNVSARVSIIPSYFGEKVVIRLLGNNKLLNLSQLNLPAIIEEMISASLGTISGMILLGGATGSGKTTTLYAIIKQLLGKGLSISSIEDPVELLIPGICQTNLNRELGLDYSNCLKAVLRQDPDVILIGEIRDKESAELVLEAALTGHLVLSTLHAKNCKEIFLRFKQFKLDQDLIAQVLKLLLSQSLIRKLCDFCKVIDLQVSNKFGKDLYQAIGCEKCEYQGYLGRIPICEALGFNKEFPSETLVGDKATRTSNIYKSAQSALLSALTEGLITQNDYLREIDYWL